MLIMYSSSLRARFTKEICNDTYIGPNYLIIKFVPKFNPIRSGLFQTVNDPGGGL